MRLFRTLILRPLRRDLLRTILSILSVALGVAVIIAIDLAGDAATGSFQSSLATVAGATDLEISAVGGVDEQWIARLDALPLTAHFAPIVEAQATIPHVGSFPLYGVDAVAAANPATSHLDEAPAAGSTPAVLSSALAERLNHPSRITVNLTGTRRELSVAGTVDAGPAEFLLIDIAGAQQLLNRYGKLDRIDVTVPRDGDFPAIETAIRRVLPPSYLVQRPGARSEENQHMLRAFKWNLRVLSYISLVVGAFLIYNTISVSVVRRRGEIGVLRAVGASRGTVFFLFLAEAMLLGLAGAAIGVALGRLLAAATVETISATVNALFTTSRPTPVALTPAKIAAGLLTGIAVAFASAFAPAREAMRVAPTEAMGRGAHEFHARLRWRRALVWSAICALLASAASQAPPIDGFPIFGYAAALLAIAAAALAAPASVLAINRVIRALAARRAETLLASRSLNASLSRTSVVAAALATAIAMMASVGIMVGSFRETVALWLDIQLRADLYIRPAVPASAGEFPPLPPQTPDLLGNVPGIAAVDLFHALPLHFRGERATLGAGNIEIVRRNGRLRFLRGEDRAAVLRSLPHHDRAIVSEPFANRFHLRPGDRVSIPLGDHSVTLTIAGIYYDYSTSQGYLIVDNSTLLKYLPNQPATNAAIYLAPGAALSTVQREVERRTAGLGLAVAANAELRRASMEVFDRTFAITWALEAVAILVAMLGAANALLALVLDRRRELGLLRYLGASAAQIRNMILTEAGLLALFASAIGLALGFALSLLLIFVVNKQSFGWTIQFHPPLGLLAGALLLVWCVTVLAGLYPARVASRLNPIEVIHEE
ncbi:MAG TPA: FtsX-like permease family protein [Candidatus Limnocylindrales bacterium]|nr:FtsX-like permease family protein [Candidatus Limnocylindrales bacterium]